ncbi:MAG TPA: hypothetical protein V6D05_18680 [Stenomitos sp.]
MKQHQLLPVSLVALSFTLGAPALAQMKTSKPAAAPTPAATPSATPAPAAATPSIQATPAPMPAAQTVEPGEPMPPIGLKVFGNYDFMGTVANGGFVSATTQAPGTNAPALAQASPSIPASGWNVGAEYDLAFLSLGAKYQTFAFGSPITAAINPTTGVTQTTAPNFDVFLPQNYWQVYGRLGALTIGYRNENYAGTGFGGSYGDLVAGLNFGFGIDPVSLNFGVLGGYNLSKPAGLPANISHMPAEGDVNLALNFGLVKAKLGYKAMAVANADAGSLLTALTNPSALIAPGGASQDTLTALYNTRYGLYTGPYAGLEFGF